MLTLSAISSAALAFWASEQKAKIKETNAMVDTLNATFEYPMSCLGSLLTSLPHQDVKKLVFIRGVILPTSFANIGGLDKVSSSSSSSPNQGVGSAINILRSPKTGQHAVVVEKTTTVSIILHHIKILRTMSIGFIFFLKKKIKFVRIKFIDCFFFPVC